MELNANYYWDSTAPNGIPYRMIGLGTLQLTDEGLVATGYAMRSGAKAVLIFLAYCIGALATGITLSLLMPKELSVIGMAIGLFGAVGIYWRFHRKKGPQDPRGEKLRLNILWGAILELGESSVYGSVYLKLGPRSTLYFVPELQGHSILEFLHELRTRNAGKAPARAA